LVAGIRAEFMAEEHRAFVSTQFHPDVSGAAQAKKFGNVRWKNNFFRGDKPGNNGDNRRDLCRMMSATRYCLRHFRKIVRENRP
jgi:hypothetical protein